MPQEFSSEILAPSFACGSQSYLSLTSTLEELPLCSFQVETSCTGIEVARIFDQYSLLPGVILLEYGKYTGMISRRRLLEFLIRPFGKDLFFQQPLSILYSYARSSILVLSDSTPILTAMQLALRRERELLGEPVVVLTAPNTYRLLNVHELNIASWQIRGIETQVRYERSQAQMIQNEKMASLGRLVDGIAHEILDPVSFVWGNLSYVSTYCQDLLKLTKAYDENFINLPDKIAFLKEEMEFDFLEADLTKVLGSIRTGAERLKKLVVSLQTFCHIDEVYPKPVDLHLCIDSIVLLINSRLKGEIEIVQNYGYLPPVYCFLGQLNQVFMNILSLAVDSLLDKAVGQQFTPEYTKNSEKSRIEITTEVISQQATKSDTPNFRWVAVRITDNGSGMSEELQQQIIDSFSVEKRADKETSLAVSYQIVTARHGGKFKLRSQLGIGTEFEILLPLV